MTLSQLLNSDADTLEKLTNDELNKFFEPYLRVTRPEMVAEERAKNPHANQGSVRHSSRTNAARKKEEELDLFNKLKMAEQLAAQRGIKLKLT